MTDLCPPIDPTVKVLLTWNDGDDTLTLPPGSGFDDLDSWWNVLSWPFFDYRYTYAPTSEWLPGGVLLSAVPGQTSIPIGIVVQTAATDGQAGLMTARAAVDEAFRAPDLTIAFLIDDVSVGEWAADPSIINWGPVSTPTLGIFALEGSAAVPVNPVEAT